MHRTILTTVAATAALLATAATAQQNPNTRFSIQLTGAQEPDGGDPDGSGSAQIRINTRANLLCYTLRVRGIDPATAAHIHEAPAGSAGPVVIDLKAPTNGSSTGCMKVDRQELLEIIAEPENYYVNVHNPEYPAGAVRGQLD